MFCATVSEVFSKDQCFIISCDRVYVISSSDYQLLPTYILLFGFKLPTGKKIRIYFGSFNPPPHHHSISTDSYSNDQLIAQAYKVSYHLGRFGPSFSLKVTRMVVEMQASSHPNSTFSIDSFIWILKQRFFYHKHMTRWYACLIRVKSLTLFRLFVESLECFYIIGLL